MKRELLSGERGFTLVEMLTALVITSAMFTAIYGVYASGLVAWFRSEDQLQVEENLRIGIDRLMRELRQAEYIESFAYDPAFPDRTSETLTFYLLTRDQGETGPTVKRVSYYCKKDLLGVPQLLRRYHSRNGVVANPVARYVSDIEVLPPDPDENTGLVTVTLVGEKGRSGEMRVSTSVKLRKVMP